MSGEPISARLSFVDRWVRGADHVAAAHSIMFANFSFSKVQSVAPTDLRRWAIQGTLLAAVGYTVITLLALWQASAVNAFYPYSQPVAALACWGAVWIAMRGQPLRGVAVAIGAFWFEVHAAFALAPEFPSPGLLATPVIVIATGLLFGARAALGVAVASIAITGPIYILAPAQRAMPFTRTGIYWLAVHAIVTLVAWVLIAISLAALQRMLLAVREKEEELEEMIARAPDGIIVIGHDDRVLAANPAALRLLGLSDACCSGRTISEVLTEAGGDPARALHLAAAVLAPVAWTFAREGQLPLHVEVTWRQLDVRRRQLMLRDVSERVRADAARHEFEAQLAQAQRLEAVGLLAGGVAHDFNNLLMSIGGSAALLRDEVDHEQRALLLDEVVAAQERGAALTRQLLAFARREVTRPVVFDLSALVAGLHRVLQRVVGETVRVHCTLEDDCRIRADVGQIEQVLVNLVANARDAMTQGGTCTIHVTRATDDIGSVWVYLRVVDSGIGMDAATAARAFEPFFTTKPRGRGTGLGLASVHGVVLQSGGRVSLESRPGSGTTIMLAFPFVSAPVESTDSLGQDHEGAGEGDPPATTARILVAEDDDSTRAVVGRLLKRAGYRVELVPDGVQGLRRIESDPTSIDLLVTDVMMPGLNGPQLAAQAMEFVPSLPVIYMSGYPEDVTTSGGGLSLDQGFLPKPFSGADLLRLVAAKLGVASAHK